MKTLEDKYKLILEGEDEPVMSVDQVGTKWWSSNGKLHRLDGPAIEWADGDKEWVVNGKLHRLDGPAVEYTSGYGSYWLYGRRYSYEDWLEEIELLKGIQQLGDLRQP